jgi:hypothetical protein
MKYIDEFIKYKESKGEKAIYRVNDNCGNTYYGKDYVHWLEEQLRIHDVVGQSEQLPLDNFCKVCNLPTDGEKCYYKRCPV